MGNADFRILFLKWYSRVLQKKTKKTFLSSCCETRRSIAQEQRKTKDMEISGYSSWGKKECQLAEQRDPQSSMSIKNICFIGAGHVGKPSNASSLTHFPRAPKQKGYLS
jgi:hypothetical protein